MAADRHHRLSQHKKIPSPFIFSGMRRRSNVEVMQLHRNSDLVGGQRRCGGGLGEFGEQLQEVRKPPVLGWGTARFGGGRWSECADRDSGAVGRAGARARST